MRTFFFLSLLALVACGPAPVSDTVKEHGSCDYNKFKTPGNYQAGGVQMIDIVEGYKV
jgi:hypothetical protein